MITNGFKKILVMAFCTLLLGCGTLIYPERRGQSFDSSVKIDTEIAILNALGMVVFFVPGVVAFGVDFATGAIYLPSKQAYTDKQ